MDELGVRAQRIRKTQGLTLNAVAHAAGIDPGQLSRLEHGQAKRPGHRTLSNLAAALRVSVPELTGEAEPELLAAGEEFAIAHRWAQFVPDLADVDVESHLRTLAKLSPAARAEIVAYARWRGQQEHTAQRGAPPPRDFVERQGDRPRILGEQEAQEYRTAG